MDQRRFDALARLVAQRLNRRAGIGAAPALVLAVLLEPKSVLAKRRGKGHDHGHRRSKGHGAASGDGRHDRKNRPKHKHKHNRKDKRTQQKATRNHRSADGPRNCDDIRLKVGADLASCDLRQHPDLLDADFTDAKLEDAVLSGVTLANASFRGARLWRAKLDGAVLTNAQFGDSRAQRTDIFGVDFRDADLTGAALDPDAVLYAKYAIFCNTTMPNGEVDNSGCK
jgi:hypothetical protein